MQLSHYNTSFSKRNFPIILVCDNVTNAPNIGSLFRTADAFGVEKLILCGRNIQLGKRMARTARSTEKVVHFEISELASKVVSDLKDKGHYVVALEITSNSKPIHTFRFPADKPIVLVIGDENFGISETTLKHSDVILHINMFGQNSSMNVVQAANIALYEITKQLQ